LQVREQPNLARAWYDLARKFHLLSGQSGDVRLNPRDITPWPCLAFYQAQANRIGECPRDDRDRLRQFPYSDRGVDGGGEDDVRLESHHLFRERRYPIPVAIREAIYYVEVAAFDVAEFPHTFQKTGDAC
jgi:hypothetical protein